MAHKKKSAEGELDRRDFLKVGLASGAALVAGSLTPKIAFATTTYFGLDSLSEICCGMGPLNFYIGRGGGLFSWNDNYFDYNSAVAAGANYTYVYWDLVGPDLMGNYGYTNPYNFGSAQGNSAAYAWFNGHSNWSYYTYGKTIFADVEEGNGGWGTSLGNNQSVLNGFLDAVYNYQYNGSRYGLVPGIYTRPNIWTAHFNATNYRTSKSAVLWVTGCMTNDSHICSPCSANCSTTKSNVAYWLPHVQATTLGGNYSVLWQYWIDCVGNCGCSTNGDWDAAAQSGYVAFSPQSNSQYNYYYSC